MIFDPILDIFRGKAITIPPLDGAFRANTGLDDSAVFAELPAADNLCAAGGRLFASSGAGLYALSDGGAPEPVETFASAITALAAAQDGALAVALDDGTLLESGQPVTLPKGIACITALAYGDDGSLWLANGSEKQPASAWVADLMEKNASGSVWRRKPGDAFAKVEGDNWAGGYNFGILYEPSEHTRFGFSYRSQIKQQLTGNARFKNTISQFSDFGLFVNTNVSAAVNLPETVSLSAWHDFNDSWSVMADATWTGWENFDELRIKYDSFQPDTVVDESWNNVWRYSLGLNYRISNWTLRAGTAYDQSPIPNARHRTARIPGEDRTWVSVGAGYRFNQRLAVDVGYSHLFIDDPKIDETSNGGNLNGKYDAEVDILSAQVVWNI